VARVSYAVKLVRAARLVRPAWLPAWENSVSSCPLR